MFTMPDSELLKKARAQIDAGELPKSTLTPRIYSPDALNSKHYCFCTVCGRAIFEQQSPGWWRLEWLNTTKPDRPNPELHELCYMAWEIAAREKEADLSAK
jgi:hypothetical protein